jgi:CDP-glucose 4,6-dehydratase
MHLAAQALIRRSYDEPVLTFQTNVMGTINVLEAVRQTPSVRVVVVVTSDKCYENRGLYGPYREEDAMGGHDPYSASKGCAELVTSAWRRSYLANRGPEKSPVALASARAGNVIGGGDWASDRLVPDCIRAFAAGVPVFVRNPHATRPWQHVLEPLCGYLILAERLWRDGPAFSEGWNFGPLIEDPQPVSRIVEQLATLWGERASWEPSSGHHPHEARFLAIDPSKARARLAWRPRLALAEALAWTTEWYKRYYRGAHAATLVFEQIGQYERF